MPHPRASERDLFVEFPGATPDEAATIAQECGRALQAAGVDKDSIKLAGSDEKALELGSPEPWRGRLASHVGCVGFRAFALGRQKIGLQPF
jgi:hypothetical protein